MHRLYLKAEAADCAGLLVTVAARHRADRASSRQACGQMAGSTVMASAVGEPINHSFPSEADLPTAILLGVLVVQRDPGRRQNALLPLCYLLQCRRHPPWLLGQHRIKVGPLYAPSPMLFPPRGASWPPPPLQPKAESYQVPLASWGCPGEDVRQLGHCLNWLKVSMNVLLFSGVWLWGSHL